jgi:hypothetical protein
MLTLNTSVLILIGMFVFAAIFIYSFRAVLDFKHSKRIIINFADYTSVHQFYMEKAYDMIHKDRILVYSLESTRIPEEQINVVTKDFISLVEKLIGPRLRKEFIYLYGNYETFAFVMVEYFSTNYENDAIRRDSVSEMMESESQLET